MMANQNPIIKTKECFPSLTVAKSFVIIFDVVYWFFGLLLLTLGIWMLVELHKYLDISSDFTETIPYVFIGSGIAIALVGLLSCCCAFSGNAILLYLYGSFIMVLLVIQLSAGISGYVHRNSLKEDYYKGLNRSLYEYTQDAETAAAVNVLQSTVHCCGGDNYADWYKTPFSYHQTIVPKSCCVNPESCDVLNMNHIFQQGCYGALMALLASKSGWIVGAIVLSVSFQLIGAILMCCLGKNTHRANYSQLR
ncbi:tetraspanin-7-like [Artemia franciscana]